MIYVDVMVSGLMRTREDKRGNVCHVVLPATTWCIPAHILQYKGRFKSPLLRNADTSAYDNRLIPSIAIETTLLPTTTNHHSPSRCANPPATFGQCDDTLMLWWCILHIPTDTDAIASKGLLAIVERSNSFLTGKRFIYLFIRHTYLLIQLNATDNW